MCNNNNKIDNQHSWHISGVLDHLTRFGMVNSKAMFYAPLGIFELMAESPGKPGRKKTFLFHFPYVKVSVSIS